jgi:hypothetical protein
MGLVDYSDSSEGEDEADKGADARERPTKRRKLSDDKPSASLPPLPAAFRDLYSSTVRTSSQDDPSLHGGRKRVTPHVAGNWPAHVYLECKSCAFLLYSCSSSRGFLYLWIWARRGKLIPTRVSQTRATNPPRTSSMRHPNRRHFKHRIYSQSPKEQPRRLPPTARFPLPPSNSQNNPKRLLPLPAQILHQPSRR